MGWLDSLASGFGDFFGGGGSPDPFSLDTPGILDAGTVSPGVSDFLASTQPFSFSDFTQQLGDIGSTIGNIGSGIGSFFSGGPGDLGTTFLGDLSGAFGGGDGGGFSLPGINQVLPTVSRVLGGGGGGTPQTPPVTRPATPPATVGPTAAHPTANVPGLTNTPGVLNTVGATLGGGGNGLGSFLQSILGNSAVMGMIPGIFNAISSKDQTNLGPDAAKLRELAGTNDSLIKSLSAEAQAERTGMLPGPAMSALAESKREQQAGMNSAYARMGMSGSSAAAADAAALNAKNESERFNIGQNMASEAIGQVQNLTGTNVGIYQDLMQAQTARDEEYMQAMSELAGAFGKALGGLGSAAGAPAAGSPGPAAPDFGGQPATTPGASPGSTVADIVNQINGVTSGPQISGPPVEAIPPPAVPLTWDVSPITPPDASGLVSTPDDLASIAQALGFAA